MSFDAKNCMQKILSHCPFKTFFSLSSLHTLLSGSLPILYSSPAYHSLPRKPPLSLPYTLLSLFPTQVVFSSLYPLVSLPYIVIFLHFTNSTLYFLHSLLSPLYKLSSVFPLQYLFPLSCLHPIISFSLTSLSLPCTICSLTVTHIVPPP
jgi:hypothetical protein